MSTSTIVRAASSAALVGSMLLLGAGCKSGPEPTPDQPPAQEEAEEQASGEAGEVEDAEPEEAQEPVMSGIVDQEFTLRGSVARDEGEDPLPEGTQIVSIWSVDSPAGDYAYAFGQGKLVEDGSAFELTLPSGVPPVEMLNSVGEGVMGVGMIAALPPGVELPQGRIEDPAVFEQLLAVSSGHAMIYRVGALVSWTERFPEKVWTCGAQAPPVEEASFETFEPVPCEDIRLEVGDGPMDWANWT